MPNNTDTDGYLASRVREGTFIGVTAACLYLLMALLTYSERDPGWSATGSDAPVSNLGGPTGAWLADVFFSLVGYAAYLCPLLLAYRALVLLLHRHDLKPFDWTTFGIRALGLVLVMIAGTALAARACGAASKILLENQVPVRHRSTATRRRRRPAVRPSNRWSQRSACRCDPVGDLHAVDRSAFRRFRMVAAYR